MNILVITGDASFKPGHPRFDLQASHAVLTVVLWGRGHVVPRIPEGSFDVVTVQDPFWRGLVAWPIARFVGARLNVQVHADLRGQSWIRRLLARFVLRRAQSIRVVSEAIKKQVEALGARARITVLPVYVDLPAFSSVMRSPHVGKNILWLGRFETEKNPLEAIRILEEVIAEIPDARLTMLGDGSLKEKLGDRPAGLPVQIPLGWQNPLLYLDTADVVLCTSWHESWGASIVEALAAGVPVVAPDVGIAKEAGATVVPRERLADAVIKTLQSGQAGALRLRLLSKDAWAAAWLESL